MMQHYLLVLSAVCLISSVHSDTNYRLNSPLIPSQYSIVITPYFNTGDDRAFTFDGEVSIILVTNTSNVNTIRLHSEDLIYNASDISLTSETTVIGLNPANPISVNGNYSFVDFNLEAALQVEVQYTLAITYRGPIRADLTGFYRSSYVESGEVKWLGATQMEPTHARKVFPCLDEPQYKAVFSLVIDRPAHYSTSLANTLWSSRQELANGMVRDIFEPTPVMSTYLVAFLVSEYVAAEFSINGENQFGVYTRADAANQTSYTYDFGMRVEQALSDYLQLDYFSVNPNLKLDHVALLDFNAGAMENWGLVKYREGLLLYVPEESTPYYRYRVAQIMAHETTHMWFGNLVTCHWWSNTWLNEGFANYFQDFITAMIEPEVGSADMLVTGSVYSAYSADETSSAPAISNDNVNSPAEISEHFGTITYQKAGSVIRMIHHLIGDQAFRTGLNQYLMTNQLNVGYPEYMYAALNVGVQNTSSLQQYPGVTVTDVMSSWITQPGHPVLQVDVNYGTGEVSLSQRRFYRNSQANQTDEVYMIPITYTTEDKMDFNNTKPAFIMNNSTYVFHDTDVANQSWILFNIQETGFYRVNYDTNSWSRIATALKEDENNAINHLNRAKVVNDLFAFFTAEEVNFATLYEVFGFLEDETDYSVWYAAITGLNSLRSRFIGSDILDDIDSYILNLMENVITQHGYVERTTDDFVTLRNRMQVLDFACKLGHEGCIQNAVALFNDFKENGTKIAPSLRPVAYCTGLRYGDADDFDFLWQQMSSTNVANEALVIQSGLGCTSVAAKQIEYLNSVSEADGPIRWQDVTVPVTSILADHSNADLVLDFVEANYTYLSTIYPSMNTVVGYIAGALHTDAQFTKFESWLNSCTACSDEVKQAGEAALASARASTDWATAHRDEILRSLRNHSVAVTPSLMLVLLACAAVGVKSL